MDKVKNFALIGAAGYIAPRHMKAIKETGNHLVAAMDKNDSVGIIDSFFPEADFFVEYERFDRHIDLLKRKGEKIDYVAIASPNYLHDSHIRFALKNGADAICEKPLVLNPHNIDALKEVEQETGNKVYNILQLRLHPSIISLKEKVAKELLRTPDKIFEIDLSYLTSRGHWYFTSWKGDDSKSGGIATNIGVHFYDMLSWIFGSVKKSEVYVREENVSAGYLELENARVKWFLSVDSSYLPEHIVASGQRTYRSITVDGDEIEFSGGFTDLHTASYQHILEGKGFGLEEARSSIEIVSKIRTCEVIKPSAETKHPFIRV
ncbi:UDP-N-acetyl-2-amino-2-deoxy-D-glucuronate oxidase [Pseudoalteromonas holothuriae]|uniref:UDP-N-acetyl-2-amino-2-deoxy-D-glucuronate oxidase n=1 Tax=Pseudoalteromonas holothuriae TaxID=2963714 RepID=A0A9W4QWR7_9GAMM|nr:MULTISPECIES: Gfo/Idh/MocA family oxidoreductase [unclassified Pseudoalteromonas]CAH9052828.1 UDP-N-acetyl-2-amino-2-deoxy-D-glucuronate oxidase [Pseudoalteromonas sp. CIP111951]CAH9056698.1 UDP-N-acetyl-2-amino-2-deoxy-D-glucuronate oxidase [Pseudoalteromonas sp. CIP111854]